MRLFCCVLVGFWREVCCLEVGFKEDFDYLNYIFCYIRFIKKVEHVSVL